MTQVSKAPLAGCTKARPAVAFLFAVLVPAWAGAADILVSPGDETLSAAVAAAAGGDTLILQDGGYSGATLTIDKPLTLRANGAAAVPALSMQVNLAAATIMHGLVFQNIVSLNTGDDFGFFENTFNSNFRELTSTRSVIAIGNSFFGTSSTFELVASTERIVAAGNRFVAAPINVRMSATEVFFVGNEITTSEDSGSLLTFFGGSVKVWANRFSTSTSGGSTSLNIINLSTDVATVRNNLFKQTGVSGTVTDWTAVAVPSGLASVIIENNVFDLGNLTVSSNPSSSAIIQTGSFARIRSNIFTGSTIPNTSISAAALPGTRFENNLCFETLDACPAGDGNLNADPLFVDKVDYTLMTGSPAIDAGPADGVLLDVDGSTIDLGIYGGSFAIDQYDVQREPARIDPYIYPLFDATSGLDGLGNLLIRVAGVARLR